jgi:trimeric autotransporter adhesin
MIGLKKKKSLNAPTKKPMIANSSAAKKVFHDSFVPLIVNSNNGASCSRVKKVADGCPITVLPYDDEMDNMLALRSLPSSSLLHDSSSVRIKKHYSGSQLLKPFPGSRASSASSTRGQKKFDLTVKSSLLTDTQKEFIQLDSDDDVDNDFEDTVENSIDYSTNIKRSVPSSSSPSSTSGTRDVTDRSGKRITEYGQDGFNSHDKFRRKLDNRDDCIYIDSADSKKGIYSVCDPGTFDADHDVYDTSSPIKNVYNSDDDTLEDNLDDNLEDTPPRQKRSKELPIRCSDNRTKDVPPSQGTGRLNRSALKTDQNDTSGFGSRLSDKYGSHGSSTPYGTSRTEDLIDSDDDCATGSRRKVPRASSDSTFERDTTTWICNSCTLENSVRDEMCTACMQHQADNKIHDLDSIEDTPVHSKEGNKSRKDRGQTDIIENHIGVNSSSSSGGKKQVSLIVQKEKTSAERARSMWLCSWCKAENGMRRLKCELCFQRRVTEENINDRISENENMGESGSSGDEDDDATVEDEGGSGSGEEGVSDFDEEFQKEKKRKTNSKNSTTGSSSSSSSKKNSNSNSGSNSSSNRKVDSNEDKRTVKLQDTKSKRESDVTNSKRHSDVSKNKRESDVTKKRSKDPVETDEDDDNVNLFDEYDKLKKRKSEGKREKNVKVSEACKKSKVDKKEIKVIEIVDDKDETEEDEDEVEMKGEGVKEVMKKAMKGSLKEGEKRDLASSSDDDDRRFLFNMSDDSDEQEENEDEEEDDGEEEDDERGVGSQAFENYFSQRQSPPVRSKVSTRTDNGWNVRNGSKSSCKNDITISDDDDDDGRNPRSLALSSSRRLGMTASKGSDSKEGRSRGRVTGLLDLTGGGSDEEDEGSGSDSDGLNKSSANRRSSSHSSSRDRENGAGCDRDGNRYRERHYERDRDGERERERDMESDRKRKRAPAINIDDIEGDSEEDVDDLFSSAMFRNKGSKDKGGRREEGSSRAEPAPTHPNITPHFW